MIPVNRPHLILASATHPGMKGKPNEDRYSISAYQLDENDHTPSVLAIIADGIGGHRAGEVAAELAVKNIQKFVSESFPDQPAQILIQAFIHANQIILNQSRGNPSLSGMGTTCVCVWVIGDQLYAASVGDSRLYLQRGAELSRLTTDHTWVQEALTRGTLTPEQARSHPSAHIIQRFLGTIKGINPDLRLRLNPEESSALAEANQGMRLFPGDRLLLCTDGLTDLVRDAEILNILRSSSLKSGLTQLISLANQRGGHDNITIITLEVPQQPVMALPAQPSKKLKIPASPRLPRTAASWWMLILLVIAILMMILLLVYTYLY